jgi:hypothetical protein
VYKKVPILDSLHPQKHVLQVRGRSVHVVYTRVHGVCTHPVYNARSLVSVFSRKSRKFPKNSIFWHHLSYDDFRIVFFLKIYEKLHISFWCVFRGDSLVNRVFVHPNYTSRKKSKNRLKVHGRKVHFRVFSCFRENFSTQSANTQKHHFWTFRPRTWSRFCEISKWELLFSAEEPVNTIFARGFWGQQGGKTYTASNFACFFDAFLSMFAAVKHSDV